MTVFYDFKTFMQANKGNIDRAYKDIKNLSKYSGKGFIVDMQAFILSCALPLYKIQYLYLASKRNYADYFLFGISTLDSRTLIDIDLTEFKPNPLLTFNGHLIEFKY